MCARTDVDVKNSGVAERRRQLVLRMRRLASAPGTLFKPPPLQPTSAPEPQVPIDTLALVTTHQKKFLDVVYAKLDDFKQHPSVSVLLRTTQPAHVLMVAAVLFVSSSLMQLNASASALPSTLNNLAYLAAFSTHLGNQFWMTFVSGLALYFNLPRHHFGAVQKILFPKYFSINSFLSLVSLISFTKLNRLNSMQTSEFIQVAVLSSCFFVELSMRLYLVPSVIEQISAKTELEVAAGVGAEVGRFSPGPLLRCPHYKRIQLRFRRLHTAVAAGNMATMACSTAHLYYIAQHWICQVI